MNHALLLVFVLFLAILVSRAVGEVLGWSWEWARPHVGVHPWALHAPWLVTAVPIAGLLVAGLALVPSVPWTWLSGACACEVYGGLHVCPLHPEAALQLLPPLVLFGVGTLALGVHRALRVVLRIRDLDHLTTEVVDRQDGLSLVDCGGQATVFVAGVLRPRVFVDAQWWSGLPRRDRSVIEAHERAHVHAGDPRARAWLELLLGLFAPGARGAVLGDWLLAAELRADERAADEHGDPLFVAEVLCRYARAAAPSGALALGGAALATRVEALVEGRRMTHAPWSSSARVGAAVAMLPAGHLIHRLLEAAIRLVP